MLNRALPGVGALATEPAKGLLLKPVNGLDVGYCTKPAFAKGLLYLISTFPLFKKLSSIELFCCCPSKAEKFL